MQLFINYSNVIGLFGVSLILSAYLLINTGKLTVKALSYQLMNLVGSWLILYSLFFHWNLASVIIEIVWIAISSIGLYKAVKSYSQLKRGYDEL